MRVEERLGGTRCLSNCLLLEAGRLFGALRSSGGFGGSLSSTWSKGRLTQEEHLLKLSSCFVVVLYHQHQ